VVERRDRTAVATYFASERPVPGRVTYLEAGEAHHAMVRRVVLGERVRLVDGNGCEGWGQISRLSKSELAVDVDDVATVIPPEPVHLHLPVADRDRMLWLAEKAVELGATSWRPVLWRRSRSVSPRGEGVAFQSRVRARMISALTQSGGAWLPVLFPDATVERAMAAAPAGRRILLDAGGEPMTRIRVTAPLSLAVGPEGGLEDVEREALVAGGWVRGVVSPHTLRFETAGMVGLALARAMAMANTEGVHGR